MGSFYVRCEVITGHSSGCSYTISIVYTNNVTWFLHWIYSLKLVDLFPMQSLTSFLSLEVKCQELTGSLGTIVILKLLTFHRVPLSDSLVKPAMRNGQGNGLEYYHAHTV